MTDVPSIRQTVAKESRVGAVWDMAPEALAALVLVGVGLLGWQAATDDRDERARASFALVADHYLERLERELLDTRDALELDIVSSRVGADASDLLDWVALDRRVEQDARHPELGRVGLAVPIHPPDGEERASDARAESTATAAERRSTGSTRVRLDIVRGGAEGFAGHAIGTDLLAAAHTRESALVAQESGHAVLHVSATSSGARRGPGTWLYAPLYAIDTPWSLQDRRSQFIGLGFAPVDLPAIMARVAGAFPELAISARLGDTVVGEADSRRSTLAREVPSMALTASRDLLGRRVDFDIRSTPAFPGVSGSLAPSAWLLHGALAAGLLIALAARRAQASRLSRRRLSERLSRTASRVHALERVNADLESFAHVVSHDLKTPLRKMQALTDLLVDDLAVEDGHPIDPDDVAECLRRLRAQTSCMDALIAGIHAYSSTAVGNERIETIDTRASIESVAASIGVPSERLQLHGDFPVIRTWPVRFEQVMANLIGNAFKYHDRPAEAEIEVSVSGFGDYSAFSVRDDGPGIDPREHERIFDVFESIRVPGVESSGIGLSIVRKAVESAGGRLSLDSEPGAGSVFRFTWPKDIGTDTRSHDSRGDQLDGETGGRGAVPERSSRWPARPAAS